MSSTRETVPAEVRREHIAQAVASRGFVHVDDLSRRFGVSAVTVRSDLDALAAQGGVRRIRGGAVPAGAPLVESGFEQSLHESAAEKRRIAEAVVGELESGMSVLLDVGTTTLAVAHELVRRESLRDLTVVTNGLSIALALEAAIPRLQVVVTGGTLRPLQHSLIAPLVEPVLAQLRVDVAFIGCNGVDAAAGVTNINLPEAEVKRAMVAAASRCVVVADGSKIGRVHVGRVIAATDADLIVTGASAPAAALEELRAAGARAQVVE